MTHTQPLWKLKAIRAEHGLTQREFADILKISEVSYAQRERGNIPFTQWEIDKLLETFNLKYEDVFAKKLKKVVPRDVSWKN